MNEMTNKELREKIDRLEAELAEVKEKVAALPKRIGGGGLFKPKDGQEFWGISGYGMLFVDNWRGNDIECDKYAIGNCFPTEQAAADAIRVLKLIQKARESQNGFVPDWENWEQNKYALSFEMGDIHIMQYASRNIAPIFGYWEDESVCEQFVRDNHDELLWFFVKE